jgi:hypothetical protein
MYKWFYACIIASVLACGCASKATKNPLSQYYYRHPETDIRQVGATILLELDNQSEVDKIAEDATNALFLSMQHSGLLGMSIIRQSDPEWGELDLSNFKKYTLEQLSAIKNTLHCKAVLSGSITTFTPYPHLKVGLRLKLTDINSGTTHWAFEYIWDTADEATQKRIEKFYTQKNILGQTESKDRLGTVSSKKFLRFVAYETSQTLGPKK